jgi:predicted MFS family arabinose efflux permease
VVSSGIFIATVASLPAASLIGTLTTWRAAFAVAAVFALIAVAAQLAGLPRLGAGGRVRPRSLLTVLTFPVSRIGLVAAGANFFANFAAYTYVGPLLHARTGLGASAMTLVLLGFGLAGAAGNFTAGVTVRRHLRATLMGSGLLVAVSALLLAAVTGARPLTIALVAVWGLGFGAVPVAAQSWMVRAMPANLEGGLALFVSALQGSLAAGSAAGGVIYDAKGPGAALGWPRPSRPPDHSPCWAGPARASALGQQAPLTWPASGARNRPHGRQARAIKQETAHEHAEVRGHTEAVTTGRNCHA